MAALPPSPLWDGIVVKIPSSKLWFLKVLLLYLNYPSLLTNCNHLCCADFIFNAFCLMYMATKKDVRAKPFNCLSY